MKKTLFIFAISVTGLLGACSKMQHNNAEMENNSSFLSMNETGMSDLNGIAQDTSKSKSKSAHPKKTTAQKSTVTKKDHITILPSDAVEGEAGAGSGVGSGGSTSGADTMKIMK